MALFTPLARLALTRFRWFQATRDERDAEILALRHQVLVLQRQINRAQFADTDRTILALLASVLDRRRLADVFPTTPGRCQSGSRRNAPLPA